MNLNYESLRKRYEKPDFKSDNKSYYLWALSLSYFGNIVSIFLAFFFVFPMLNNAFEAHIGSTMSNIASFIITLVLLAAFEGLKRIALRNLSKLYLINKKGFIKREIGQCALVLILVLMTFYYSSNGFTKLVDSTDQTNQLIDSTLTTNIDNVKNSEISKILYYEDNIKRLESINNDLRTKLLNSRDKNRSEFQSIIDKNVELIKDYNGKIDNINNKIDNKSELLTNDANKTKESKNSDVFWQIVFALIMSIFVEGVIIVGIVYCEKYMFKVYQLDKDKSGEYFDRKDKFKILLKYLYKDGEINIGEPVSGQQRLIDTLKDRKIENPNKLVKDFYLAMDQLNVFEIRGKRKYFKLEYSEAMKLIEQMDSKIMILDELK